MSVRYEIHGKGINVYKDLRSFKNLNYAENKRKEIEEFITDELTIVPIKATSTEELEKKIQELERQNAELKDRLTHEVKMIEVAAKDEIKQLKVRNKIMREALGKIGNHETAEDKYNSYEQAWEGVAEFAREALAEIDKKADAINDLFLACILTGIIPPCKRYSQSRTSCKTRPSEVIINQ